MSEPETARPQIVTEAFQVMECTWMRQLDGAHDDAPGCIDGYEPPYHDFNGITSKYGAHFILRVDKILMKENESNNLNGLCNGSTTNTFSKSME